MNRKRASWLLVPGLLLAGLFSVSPRSALAQEEEKPKSLPPLVVINTAGADRLLGDVDYMFKTIGREDLSEVVKGFLNNVGDLKGLDREKSMGVMLYFKPGLQPGVEPVGYVPVDNIDDLLKTVQLGPVTARKIPGEEGRYELIGPASFRGGGGDENEGPKGTLHVKLQGGYAYITNNEAAFDRELPDPGPLTKSLTERYDLAVSLNIEGIPELMRTIFLDFFRAQTQAELQQRDNEPEAAYRARKAAGINNLKNIEAVLKEGQSITLGIDASQTAKALAVELEVKARPGSGFSRQLQEFPGKPSVFANAYSEKVPLAATGSWKLSKDDKKVFAELVKAIDTGMRKSLKEDNLDPTPLDAIMKSLESTVNSGAIDFFVQFVGEPPGKFSIVGGLKIDRAGDFAAGLQGLIQQLSNLPQTAELKLNAESHNGVAIHKILGKGNGGRDEKWMFGGMPAFYIGAGRGAVWFGVGKDGTADHLKNAMTMVETIPEKPITREQIAPFQMVVNLSRWVALSEGEPETVPQIGEPTENDEEAARRAARRAARAAERKAQLTAAREAFKPENDRLLITARSIRDGFRLKLLFGEGFIRYLGIRISSQIDRNRL